MTIHRLVEHPILDITRGDGITFYWDEKPIKAYDNETVASALIANDIHIFRYHPKDNRPQGIFCVNGQCAQCMLLIDGKPEKSCQVRVHDGMQVKPLYGNPVLVPLKDLRESREIHEREVEVLIIGGGPAGLSAALELGKMGIQTLLVDDKHTLGGKLILQTHRFFGSTKEVYAGQRGIEIASLLEKKLAAFKSVEIWKDSTALAVFSDHKVGIYKNRNQYILMRPQILLNAAGAREKFLHFPGNSLPGIMGAGAFQTLVNRDFVLPAKSLFIIGGGNVGLIAGYHAVQAGIEVVGLAEAMPTCGGYKVHEDKLRRLGVPVFTSHSVISANGEDKVKSITISEINVNFRAIKGTEKTFYCDGVLIAVGLEPVNEFFQKASSFGMKVFAAGDAEKIAEASAAIFSGKIKALEIAKSLTFSNSSIPINWLDTQKILESKPGRVIQEICPNIKQGVYPILHCSQEIPCDPCVYLCPLQLIHIDKIDIRQIPFFDPGNRTCSGCAKCVVGCPGLAITLVDYRQNPDLPIITIPVELSKPFKSGETIEAVNTKGDLLGKYPIIDVHAHKKNNHTILLKIQATADIAEKIAGIRTLSSTPKKDVNLVSPQIQKEDIICLCEHVTAEEILSLIKRDITDLNEIKTISRAGMGACGGKTCETIIKQLFIQEGISIEKTTPFSKRPLFVEVPLKDFDFKNGNL